MTPPDLGDKLVDHDGINEPSSRQLRRQQMEATLASERNFANNLKWVACFAWCITLLGPIAGFLLLITPSNGNSSFAVFALLGMIGGLAFWIALVVTAAWLFRSRSTTMSVIETRLASLEELVERSMQNRNE